MIIIDLKREDKHRVFETSDITIHLLFRKQELIPSERSAERDNNNTELRQKAPEFDRAGSQAGWSLEQHSENYFQ